MALLSTVVALGTVGCSKDRLSRAELERECPDVCIDLGFDLSPQMDRCGDRYLSGAEQCEDGNDIGGDGCSADCQKERCGNSVVDVGEACDDGQNRNNEDGCTDLCALPSCGDGFRTGDEHCDDAANNGPNEACAPDCSEPFCGDGNLQTGETCDDGPANGTPMSSCGLECEPGTCGDGTQNLDEACDDGPNNGLPGFACDAICELRSPQCGDGWLDVGEACDDGLGVNGTPMSLCRDDCAYGTCGDGVLSLGEVCDDAALGTDLGDCNPACSGTVEQRILRVTTGTYAPPWADVAAVDALCAAEFDTSYAAFVAFGEQRRATTTPFVALDPIDWVLQPFTRYVTPAGTLVWVTDQHALLAVEAGVVSPLLSPIGGATADRAWTGINADGTNGAGCEVGAWGSGTPTATLGAPGTADAFPEAEAADCTTARFLVCVEI